MTEPKFSYESVGLRTVILSNWPLRTIAAFEDIMTAPIYVMPNSKMIAFWLGRLSRNFEIYIFEHSCWKSEN